MTDYSTNEMKTIIRNAKSLSCTEEVGSTLFNEHFTAFDNEFIKEYFSTYKRSYMVAAYQSKLIKSEAHAKHFIEYLIWRSQQLESENTSWFSEPYARLKPEHSKDMIFVLRKKFGHIEGFKLVEKGIINATIIYIKNNMSNIDKVINSIKNIQFSILDHDDFATPESIDYFHKEVRKVFSKHPEKTIHLSSIKGLDIVPEQIEILNQNNSYFLDNPTIKRKNISAVSCKYFDFNKLTEHPQYIFITGFEIRNESGFEISKNIPKNIKDDFFVEKTKILYIKDSLKKGISVYDVSKTMNQILLLLENETKLKLLKEINIGRLSQNLEFLTELAECIDNYGFLNDDHLELLILNYKI